MPPAPDDVRRFVIPSLISVKRCTCKDEPPSVAAAIEASSEAVKYDAAEMAEWCVAASSGPELTESGSAGSGRSGGGGGKIGDARTVRIDDRSGAICSWLCLRITVVL